MAQQEDGFIISKHQNNLEVSLRQRAQGLIRFWCLFVSKMRPNNAATSQDSIVVIVLIVIQTISTIVL